MNATEDDRPAGSRYRPVRKRSAPLLRRLRSVVAPVQELFVARWRMRRSDDPTVPCPSLPFGRRQKRIQSDHAISCERKFQLLVFDVFRSVIGSDRIQGSVRKSFDQGLPVVFAAQRWFHFVVAVKAFQDGIIVEQDYAATSAVTGSPRFLAARMSATPVLEPIVESGGECRCIRPVADRVRSSPLRRWRAFAFVPESVAGTPSLTCPSDPALKASSDTHQSKPLLRT